MSKTNRNRTTSRNFVSVYDPDDYAALDLAVGEHLARYIIEGVDPGDALRKALENDLAGFLAHADLETRRLVFVLPRWLFNRAPSDAWGSPEAVRRWIKARSAVEADPVEPWRDAAFHTEGR